MAKVEVEVTIFQRHRVTVTVDDENIDGNVEKHSKELSERAAEVAERMDHGSWTYEDTDYEVGTIKRIE